MVVEGRVQFFVNGQATDVEPGGAVYLPRGSQHSYRNGGSTPSRQWILTTPAGFEHFFARCAAEVAKAGGPDLNQLDVSYREHGIPLVGNLRRNAECGTTA